MSNCLCQKCQPKKYSILKNSNLKLSFSVMKSLQSCIFCGNTPICNISSDMGDSDHTARKNMLEFFGFQIEDHLRPNDAICNRCMNLMENVANLKRRLLPLIFRSPKEHNWIPISLGNKWDMLASKKLDDYFPETSNPSPNNFLIFKKAEPYNSFKESVLNEKERRRSASCMSEARSEGDNEVNAVFSKIRRKRKGHNWSHRKNGRYSSASVCTTRMTRSRSKALSSLSVISTEHYGNFQSSENVEITYEDELYACNAEECNFICEDIDLMSAHKSTRHYQYPMVHCYCGKKYTSSDDLAIHQRITHQKFACLACKKEFYFESDLMKHYQGHMQQSVLCNICNRRFIDEKDCNMHKRNFHKNFVIRILIQD